MKKLIPLLLVVLLLTACTTAPQGNPDLQITRGQLVTFLYRFAAPESGADISVLDTFADGASCPAYARESFAWAIENGLVEGMSGCLNASGTATRAQLATVLMRFDSLN